MKFVSIAALLALAATTQATPLFDIPGLEIPKVRTVTKTVYVTVGRDVDEPTSVQSIPIKTTSALPDRAGDSSSVESATAESTAPPAETGAVVVPSNWITAMACRINVVRAARGLQPLGLSSDLDSIAQKHSEYQNSIKQMTHSNPAGGLGDRLTAANIAWSSAAENVAAGMKTAEQAQQALENSPGHLANMVNPNLAYFGAGQVNGYYTQNFYGVSGNARALTIPKCN
ncbi:hypothetical protein GGI20_001177 [Coemansia sp. BCRC 34301]|nr:hypothetical protein GGI20_001177 [Coemansia sp. BCRC 34301]